jgi:hypothetical protein
MRHNGTRHRTTGSPQLAATHGEGGMLCLFFLLKSKAFLKKNRGAAEGCWGLLRERGLVRPAGHAGRTD